MVASTLCFPGRSACSRTENISQESREPLTRKQVRIPDYSTIVWLYTLCHRQSSRELLIKEVDPSQSMAETISGSDYCSYVSRSIKCDSSPSKGRFITVSSCLIKSRDVHSYDPNQF